MELNKIYNEDCLVTMTKRISQESVDIVLTSPPYNTSRASSKSDQTDNRVENLEMVTNQENVLHAWRQLDSTERRKKIGEITIKWREERRNEI